MMKSPTVLVATLSVLLGAAVALAQHAGHEGLEEHSDHHEGPTAQAATPEEQQRRDELRAAVQAICPVSGEKLGSMGDPLKIRIGEESVFLCCQGCARQPVKKEHWATIHKNIAKAQGTCPVMGEDLPAKPKFVVVEEQVVYVCCPPCTKTVAADPQRYLREIDALYAAAIEKKQ